VNPELSSLQDGFRESVIDDLLMRESYDWNPEGVLLGFCPFTTREHGTVESTGKSCGASVSDNLLSYT
jgi:hypothetical protein